MMRARCRVAVLQAGPDALDARHRFVLTAIVSRVISLQTETEAALLPCPRIGRRATCFCRIAGRGTHSKNRWQGRCPVWHSPEASDTEGEDAQGDLFGESALITAMRNTAALAPAQAAYAIIAEVERWSPSMDEDLTLLVCDYLAAP